MLREGEARHKGRGDETRGHKERYEGSRRMRREGERSEEGNGRGEVYRQVSKR